MRNSADLTKLSYKERGYIMGFYVGDGNIFVKPETGIYRLKFFLNRSESSIEERINKILKETGVNSRVYNWKNNTRVIEIHSKNLVAYINHKVTKDGLKIYKNSRKFLIGYMEGLIDSDGYVQRKYAEITTSNANLKDQIVKFLGYFDIKTNIRNYTSPKSGKTGWRVGFSLKANKFQPVKWISSPQTAESDRFL